MLNKIKHFNQILTLSLAHILTWEEEKKKNNTKNTQKKKKKNYGCDFTEDKTRGFTHTHISWLINFRKTFSLRMNLIEPCNTVHSRCPATLCNTVHQCIHWRHWTFCPSKVNVGQRGEKSHTEVQTRAGNIALALSIDWTWLGIQQAETEQHCQAGSWIMWGKQKGGERPQVSPQGTRDAVNGFERDVQVFSSVMS